MCLRFNFCTHQSERIYILCTFLPAFILMLIAITDDYFLYVVYVEEV